MPGLFICDSLAAAMRLYAITNRRLFLGTPGEIWRAWMEQTLRWVQGGVEFIQIREKDWHWSELLETSGVYRETTATYAHFHNLPQPSFLINASDSSQVEIACKIKMDGVHLPADAGSMTARVREARHIWLSRWPEGAAPVISVSCHTIEEVEEACLERVSMILFAPVFEKPLWEKPALERRRREYAARGGRSEGQFPPSQLESLLPGVGLEPLRAACAVSRGAAGICAGRGYGCQCGGVCCCRGCGGGWHPVIYGG